jgi:hypothetical protein
VADRGHQGSGAPPRWLASAADLLAGPDPGDTPFLVEKLIVAESIAAVQGRHKSAKTWAVLDVAISVASGRPVFDRFRVERGPVVVVVEESGRAALRRRLDRIIAGRGIKPDELRDLHFAANQGVRLNDPKWQERILADTAPIKPSLIVFDPLARVKGATVDESSQREIGPVLDFLRRLRDESGATVGFVHHTGHEAGARMRGSSDLEAYWESKLSITRARDEDTIDLCAEHREAEAAGPFSYRIEFADDPRSIRFEALDDHERKEREEFGRCCLAALNENSPMGRDALIAEARTRGAKGRNEKLRDWLTKLIADPESGLISTDDGYALTPGPDARAMPGHPPSTDPPGPLAPPPRGGQGPGPGVEPWPHGAGQGGPGGIPLATEEEEKRIEQLLVDDGADHG